jgi:hypothetical protein
VYLEKQTVITVLILLLVVVGGIAFVAFHPAAKQANERVMQQDVRTQQDSAINPNQLANLSYSSL